MDIVVPTPASLLEWTWFLIGLTLGRAFKGCDYQLQQTEWFKKQGKFTQWTIKRLLDFLHHFWIGLLLVVYAPYPELIWLGWALFVDDLPDVPRRVGKIIKLEGWGL